MNYFTNQLLKSPTGIEGLDEILEGGIPKGRITLITGDTGTGKSLMALEMIVNGATKFDEPGLYISFENELKEIFQDLHSIEWNLENLSKENKISLKHIDVQVDETESIGSFSFDILLKRIEKQINEIGAKRVVLDTLESIWSVVGVENISRWELRRLFKWFIDKGITLIVTGEKRDGTSHFFFNEFISDCIIQLEQKIFSEIVTRRLRIVKYRGTPHGMNTYPYVITSKGNKVFPITSMNLGHHVSTEKISFGMEEMDKMLGGGIFKGSSVLLSGTSGTGKSTFANFCANHICRNGGKVLYFAFEESAEQILRNMVSLSLDNRKFYDEKQFIIFARRPNSMGLEQHLLSIFSLVEEHKPELVILDPISNFSLNIHDDNIKSFLMRLVDFFKQRIITTILTSLIRGSGVLEETDEGVSSIMDTWISLQMVEQNNERNRIIKILKSRGGAHSNQLREYILTSDGVHFEDVYLGAKGMLTGSQRLIEIAKNEADEKLRLDKLQRIRDEILILENNFEAEKSILYSKFEKEKKELEEELLKGELITKVNKSDKEQLINKRNQGL
ncbi:MAG TPA: circadian clock protein KaiC [Leptospiraceae bacterium]|nr:circadian clock protein KaiC [Leptospiraceae bacterium]HMY33822.1 circadian clock protein KaiC [Leptospiraceae bacterium]HMZ65933.1 circadian clock protein KaiC [Leptospiraceae bacterium]HNA08845.1 circadian clock protein KaiC [Leptospiraceae bacterium]HNC01448.1 circadian clock protein KaiC [Leptospiraceae bacterium]